MSTKPRTPLGASAVNLAIVANDLEHVKEDVGDIKASISGINDSLKVLGRIEERQLGVVRDFNGLVTNKETIENRVSAIEQEVPSFREMRQWVIKGVSVGVTALVLGICSMAASQWMDRFFPKPPQQVYLVAPPASTPQ